MSYWLGLKQHCSKTPVRVVVWDKSSAVFEKMHSAFSAMWWMCFFVIVIIILSNWVRAEEIRVKHRDTERPCSLGSHLWTPPNPVNSRPLQESGACFRDSPRCVTIVTQDLSLRALTSGWLTELGIDTMYRRGSVYESTWAYTSSYGSSVPTSDAK